MKKLIIIDTYTSTKEQKKILFSCVEKIKNIGYDLMVVSHSPIPEEIQKNVNYFIFDSDNSFLPSEITPFFWMQLGSSFFTIYNAGHTLAITRNMQNAFQMAKLLGYEFFFFMEFDVLIDNLDIPRLIELEQEMVSQDKKMIFFEPEEFYDCGSHVYETLLFGGLVSYFLSVFNPPKNLEEWNNLNMGYTLELALYEKFSKDKDNFYIIPTHSYQYFTNSKVNLCRYGLMICELLHNIEDENNPIMFIHQSNTSPQNYKIKIYLNEVLYREEIVCGGCWWFSSFNLDNSSLLVEIFLNDELQETKNYILNKELLPSIKKRGNVKNSSELIP